MVKAKMTTCELHLNDTSFGEATTSKEIQQGEENAVLSKLHFYEKVIASCE